MRTLIFAIFPLLALSSCAPPKDDFSRNSGTEIKKQRLQRLSAGERRCRAPNALYERIYEGDLAGVKEEVRRDRSQLKVLSNQDCEKKVEPPSTFYTVNDPDHEAATTIPEVPLGGDKPLGVAIRLQEKEIALFLLDELVPNDYLHQNARGEGYVFLASKYGIPKIIETMANRYYSNLSAYSDYEFSTLDMDNDEGQRAVHVAANPQILEILESQYYLLPNLPFWQFLKKQDKKDQSFFHTAARDGRDEILRWGASRVCAHWGWESAEGNYLGFLMRNFTYFFTRGSQWAGTHVLGYFLENWQDNEGFTALHRVAERGDERSLRSFATCDRLDYSIANSQGDIPLQTFLKTLDIREKKISSNLKSFFSFLLQQRTVIRQWTVDIKDNVEHQNLEGDRSLHIAARLSDPFFYRALEKYGNTFQPNGRGETAEQLFKREKN